MAIHCHSARYHYDSFHNRGGDIINIGSNNTYNFGGCGFGASIWGNGGNFWGGFGTSLGWGLGNGLMNWLGNGLNGGGWNPAGIFGGSMGYGMNPWQQMSTFSWGGSTGGRSTSGADSSGKTKEVVKDDPDCQKIADITGKMTALKANATKDEINGIIKDIDDVVLDKNNEPAQKKTLENLRTQLKNRLASIENTTPVTASNPTTPTTPTGPATTPSKPQSTGDTNSAPVQTTTPAPWSGINKWGNNSLAQNDKVNTALKQNGYNSVSDDDTITEVKITREINGTMQDIKGNCKLSTEKVKKGDNDSNIPMYIAITSSESGKIFNYKCVGFTADGNPVYATPASDTHNNVYVLAKKSTKESVSFELIQLSGFTGHTHPDKQNG